MCSFFILGGCLDILYGTRVNVGVWRLQATQSILNCKTFDFFDTKFDHSSYSKIYVKYHFFRRGLVY